MYKEYMIKCLHLLYRGDTWVNELYNAIGLNAETVDKRLDVVYDNMFFDSLNEYGCEVFEKDLGITPAVKSTLEQRRLTIKSRWLAKSFSNLPAIQNIAKVYFGDLLEVSYDGDATLIFTTQIGLNYFDTDFSAMLNVVNDIKPAHFDCDFAHRHNRWKDYFQPLSWEMFGLETWGNRKKPIWDFWCPSFAWYNAKLAGTWAKHKEKTWDREWYSGELWEVWADIKKQGAWSAQDTWENKVNLFDKWNDVQALDWETKGLDIWGKNRKCVYNRMKNWQYCTTRNWKEMLYKEVV